MAKYRIRESGDGLFMPQKRLFFIYLNMFNGWYCTLEGAKHAIEMDKKKPVYHPYN